MDVKLKRKVGRHHLAFYRGWLHGIDLKELGDRYLETGIDLRLAKSTLKWIKEEIQKAALRHGKHGTARLLRLPLKHDDSPTVEIEERPSLAAFKEEFDQAEMWTERELIENYLEKYPEPKISDKQRKKRELVDKQLKALFWVEELLACEPHPNDLISAWLDDTVANRLILADIPDFKTLMATIHEHGYRWWVKVPKLGEKGAVRILKWLQLSENALGKIPMTALQPLRTIPSSALAAYRPVRTGIVPLESLLVPDDLNGANGLNRHAGQPLIEAMDDMLAIRSWLAIKSPSKNTQLAYRKEAERLVLWAIMERHKALSDLTVNDCAAYRDWLSMVGRTEPEQWPFNVPQNEWIGKGKAGKHKPSWKPLSGPISANSTKQAIVILNGMFGWLVKVQYLAFNPWAAVPVHIVNNPDEAPELELTRAFTKSQWDYLINYLDELFPSAYAVQVRFVVKFAYSTGMRRAELVGSTVGHLYTMPLRDSVGQRWMLKVLGKGSKWRSIPFPEKLFGQLSNYLEYRGLKPYPPDNPPETPLIAHQSSNTPLGEGMLYKALKRLFGEVSEKLKSEGKEHESRVFLKASTHWLRHTRGSHLGQSNTEAVLIQKLLGHASIATTTIYTKSDDETLWNVLSAK